MHKYICICALICAYEGVRHPVVSVASDGQHYHKCVALENERTAAHGSMPFGNRAPCICTEAYDTY